MSNYRYSFSGSDFRAVAWISLYDKDFKIISTPAVELESLTTISISLNESKAPVRSLGKKGVSGYTSSLQQIAGTLIFNIVNNHPLLALINEYQKIYTSVGEWSYSRDYELSSFSIDDPGKLIVPTTLPPINIMLIGNTELNQSTKTSLKDNSIDYVQLLLTGVELITDATAISVNNILTENVFSFVATGYEPLREQYSVSQMTLDEIDAIIGEMPGPIYSTVAPEEAYDLGIGKEGSTRRTNYNDGITTIPSNAA